MCEGAFELAGRVELHAETRLVGQRETAPLGHRFAGSSGENIGTTSLGTGCIMRNSANGLLCCVITKWYE